MINFDDFEKVDIKVGRVVEVEDFPEARKPSYKLMIDFGKTIGVKKSSAQLVSNYSKEDLRDRFVLCVVNFPPRQIGPVKSEVLVVGVPDKNGECILVKPDNEVPLGGKLY
ncbi:MAG: tRNA-binding protein [Candidatus Heimdallarchaeota archaeon]|nr:tRNA-binding protein [Candidatus Heimdallarchaeota archaeon]MCK4877750.1 tRNA-binding protein [Candidatus Heimdallarchaeota archaeon]